MANPYDPFDRMPEEQGPGFGFGVGEYYKFKYFQNPWTWSGTKGVATPFGVTGATFRTAGRAFGEGYEARGLRGGFAEMLSRRKEIMEAGTGRIWGSRDYDKYIDTLKKRIGIAQKTNPLILQERAKIFKQFDAIKRGEINLMYRQRTYGAAPAMKFNDPRLKVAMRERAHTLRWESALKKTRARAEQRLTDLSSAKQRDLSRRKDVIARLEDKLSTTISKKRLMGVRKWGIRGMKAVSAVGFMLMMKDIGMAIGEPLARTFIENTNALMERVEQRFMPEMGAKLAAAYLSYGAATERQRALEAISKAHINGRSAFGQEAAMMHS